MSILNKLENYELEQEFIKKEIEKLEIESLIVRNVKGLKARLNRIKKLQEDVDYIEDQIANTSRLSTIYDE